MGVIWWIQNQSRRFKSFVANRIGEIHDETNPSQWRYVPTKENSADVITRGLSVTELLEATTWWEGPEFLKADETEWPVKEMKKQGAVKELRKKQERYETKRTLLTVNRDESWRLQPKRYSSWTRLTRVLAWIYRFVNNCFLPIHKRSKGELLPEEIVDAEAELIKNAQREHFPDEYKAVAASKPLLNASKILNLKPMLDIDGLLRSNGRLQYAEHLSYDTKYPVILPRRSSVTRLIVKHYHDKSNHIAGTNQVLAMLSSRYWIIHGREVIWEVESQCYECKRRKAKAATQIMAPLPRIRFKFPLRAFARAAVDYGGPFFTIQGRGKKRSKRYLCLFTCLTSRAVHLEMAFGLDTDSFLNAFYRMVNRRGIPTEMLSDNGTNFVGAKRELEELVNKLDKEKIKQSTANKGIKWNFIPPLAPHFGGVHETMIKSAKRAIYAILNNSEVTDEELITAFTGAESLINSRPLTYQSADPKDDTPLTPNHFLHGQVGGEFAPESVDEEEFHPRKRWRRVQELVRHFWKRWMQEWLPSLSSRKKWYKERKDVRIGDVVLVISPDSKRGEWPLGKVIETYPGNDGRVRVVKLRVGKSRFTRSITKICPLECESNDDNNEETSMN